MDICNDPYLNPATLNHRDMIVQFAKIWEAKKVDGMPKQAWIQAVNDINNSIRRELGRVAMHDEATDGRLHFER